MNLSRLEIALARFLIRPDGTVRPRFYLLCGCMVAIGIGLATLEALK